MNRTWHKLAFFTILYFVQGAAFAYVVNFQKPYLSSMGVGKGAIGAFTSLLLIPFILKVFLGMLSDRVPLGKFGPRKPYMLIGLFVFAVCYYAMAALEPARQFTQFAALTFMASIGLALFDTCCDGWAIDVARADEQSKVQAAMVGGRSMGYIIMSLVFGFVAQELGYHSILKILSLLACFVAFVVALAAYHPLGGGQLEQSTQSPPWSEFRDWLKPVYIVFALYGVLYSLASFGTDGILTLHLYETKLSGPDVIALFGVYRGLGALAGALAFARFEPLYSKYRVIGGALVVLGAGCLLPVLDVPLAVAGCLWGFAWGLQETAFVTVAMNLSRGPWAASYFAIAMIFSNIGTSLGEALAAPLAGKMGYGFVFVGFAGLAWILAFTVPRLLKRTGL